MKFPIVIANTDTIENIKYLIPIYKHKEIITTLNPPEVAIKDHPDKSIYTIVNNRLKRYHDILTLSPTHIEQFLSCQYRYNKLFNTMEWNTDDNLAFSFGSLIHNVLETNIIPQEHEYENLKYMYKIDSWQNYFETLLLDLKILLKDYNILEKEFHCSFIKEHTNGLQYKVEGTIDLICEHKETKRILIIDYKTYTSQVKTLEDTKLSCQLYIYAYLYSKNKNILINNIDIQYFSIPTTIIQPKILSNGKLSQDKSQKISKNQFIKYCLIHNINYEEYLDFINYLSDYNINTTQISNIDKEHLKTIDYILDSTAIALKQKSNLMQSGYNCKFCQFKTQCKGV